MLIKRPKIKISTAVNLTSIVSLISVIILSFIGYNKINTLKGNIDDMIQSLISETAQELKTESSSSSDAVTAYEKLSSCKNL